MLNKLLKSQIQDLGFEETMLENKIFFKNIRGIGSKIFRRHHHHDSGSSNDYFSKVEKLEESTIITSNNSYDYFSPEPLKIGKAKHFGINDNIVKGKINLSKNKKLLWTLFGNDWNKKNKWKFSDLKGKNYDDSWKPKDNSKGVLLYSFTADRLSKIEDFKNLHECFISPSWIEGDWEYIDRYFIEIAGSAVSVFARTYKRIAID